LHAGNIPKLKNFLIETNGGLLAENDVMLVLTRSRAWARSPTAGVLFLSSAPLMKSVVFENSGFWTPPMAALGHSGRNGQSASVFARSPTKRPGFGGS